MGCAESDRWEEEPVTLLVRQSQAIPSALSHAAVILNGWHFTYLNGDHEVLGLATGLFDIQRSVRDDGSDLLEWQAFGAIRDGGYDDPFRWCYHFTVVAWDGAAYAALVDQRDARGLIGDAQGREVPFGWQTSLSFHPSYVEAYPAGSRRRDDPAAWLRLRLARARARITICCTAYNLDPGAPFIADGRQYSTPGPALDGADRAGRNLLQLGQQDGLQGQRAQATLSHGRARLGRFRPWSRGGPATFTIVPFEDQSGICAALVQDGLDQRR